MSAHWKLLTTFTAAVPTLALAATFGDDVAFLRQHTSVVVLSDTAHQAQVALVPAWQGRIVTSTARGAGGTSFGWVNRELIASKKLQPHINVFGGEDRFWLGPEGGQFSIFFARGAKFDLEHWFTPAAIDTESFEVASQAGDRAVFRRAIDLTNYTGTRFQLEATREIRLLAAGDALAQRKIPLPSGVASVAFESRNTIRNTGAAAWRKDTGLLSIWILGMFNASPRATVVIPYKTGAAPAMGPIVNDTYFGKVPADRLVIKDGVMFFRADAKYRSKIGVPPLRAKPVVGSYDPDEHTLTLVWFTLPAGATDYVNSMWELQKEPYRGDTINSYNDGPPSAGAAQLGKFFELESSSPALALAPGAAATHVHQTIHLQGDEQSLDAIARAALGVGLAQIKNAFGK